MAAALFNKPQALVPQNGVIEGGLLDGWSYGLVRVEVLQGAFLLFVRATAPKWVFPCLVVLRKADYLKLRNPGGLSTAHEMQKLIDAATAAAHLKVPAKP